MKRQTHIKSNDKHIGFTLIELITVILLMALLTILIVPAIIKTLNNTDAKLMKNQEKNIEDAAKIYLSDYCLDPISDTYKCNLEKVGQSTYSGNININTLISLDYIEKVIYKNIECEGYVTVVRNEVKSYITCGDKYATTDLLPTKLTLEKIWIGYDSVTVEASAESKNPIIKYEFKIEGEAYVDNGTVGTYTFLNLPKENTRVYVKVTNEDGLSKEMSIEIKPKVLQVPIYTVSPSGWSTSKTVTITYPEREEGYVYGYSINDGETWTTVESGITSNVVVTANGALIGRVSDGDYFVTSSQMVSQIDTTAPVVSLSSPSKTDNSINVAASASDAESGIAKYEFKIDSGNYINNGTTATYTFSGLELGNHTVYVRVTNEVGLTTEKSLNILLLSAPTYSISPSGWSTSKTVTINYPEGANLIYTYSTDEGDTWTLVENGTTVEVVFNANGTLIGRVSDGTNIVTSSQTISQIDTTAPTVTLTSPSKTTNSISVSASASDSESGISKYEFKIDSGSYVNNGTTSTYTFSGLKSGDHTTYVKVTNGAGLTTEKSLVVNIPHFAFTYTGTYTDGRTNGVGTIEFKTSGTLTVTVAGTANTITLLGGGGGGGGGGGVYPYASGGGGGGGGGAGSTTTLTNFGLSTGSYTITIGGGGAGGAAGLLAGRYNEATNGSNGTNGGNTVAFGYTANAGAKGIGGGRSTNYTENGVGGAGGTVGGGTGTNGSFILSGTKHLHHAYGGSGGAGGSPNGGIGGTGGRSWESDPDESPIDTPATSGSAGTVGKVTLIFQ